MKKMMSMILFAVSFLSFLSCSNDDETYVPQNVEFTLDYTFVESNNMSRSTGADIFDEFYEKYIKTKTLTPKSYSLKFTNIETKAYAEFNGYWNHKDGIRLIEGEYEVTGSSSPVQKMTNASDSVYISFTDTVTITKDMKTLTLKADYNAYLLMFDAENINEISYNLGDNNNTSYSLKKINENIFYLFMNYIYGQYTSIGIAHKDGKFSYIYLKGMPFEKGKYYYFNDMTNSFDLPKMESGN